VKAESAVAVAEGRLGASTYKAGGSYLGGWEGDKKAGYGLQTFRDGSKYEGEFADDKPHGKGTLWAVAGAAAGGSSEAGVKGKSGTGARGPATGGTPSLVKVYEGGFAAGIRHGHGREYFVTGDV
jgi:hypothetical protein